MRYRSGFRTHIGMRRKQNQDNGISLPEKGLFIVADGMGGHQGGETASSMVVELLPQYIEQYAEKSHQNAPWNPRRVLTESLTEVNRTIFRLSQENSKLQGMGTTSIAMLVHEEKLTIGHVGDSRCYYFRPNGIWQVTRDHSLVQEKLRAGLITRDQLKTDRMKNVITRSVGFEPDVNVEIYEMDLSHGDTFMLCSDGLTGMVEDPEILEIVHAKLFSDSPENENPEKNPVQEAVDALIDAANSHGGEDNVTVLMLQVLAE